MRRLPVQDVPNVRGVVGWCLFTWLSAGVGAVVLAVAGNWPGFLYAVNAAICAAGWWLAAARWAQWRALAEAAYSLRKGGVIYIRPEDENGD